MDGAIETTEAYEVRGSGSDAALIVTCEHASARLPPGWAWPDEDLRLLGTHWSYDIGAADLAADLAAEMGAPAILARFSRLLADPNRPLDSETLFRSVAEGLPVGLNRVVTEDDRRRRLALCYQPYHDRLDALLREHPRADVFSVHSFTPIYEGHGRTLEIGVLFDREGDRASVLCEALSRAGFVARVNEPYSGVGGFIYCAQSHADRHRRAALELEVRQDLAASPPWRERLVRALATALPVAYART